MAVEANAMFKQFKEHSVSEFFKKNRQMLGYSSMARSLVTIVHEYVTNSLDACEEAGILPNIAVKVSRIDADRYSVYVADNGPGIPKQYVGKALGKVLAGTKFHRNMQQRGQQGIGASGCTLFSQVTTGKPIHVISATSSEKYKCDVSIDIMQNKPIIANFETLNSTEIEHGLIVEGEFADVRYDTSDHGILEYLKRTALSNPHCEIKFTDPDGKEHLFVRSTQTMPQRANVSKLHPLGLTTNDLLELAHISLESRLSSFLTNSFARFSKAKLDELKSLLPEIDFSKDPKSLAWDEAERIVSKFKDIKWLSPDASSIVPIGEEQIRSALINILNPEQINVTERKPKVFKGGFPFIVEAAIAYGGNAGKKNIDGYEGNILRFANRVPLLFDSGTCAITEAVRSIQWKRYGIDLDNYPVSIFVNVSSVYIPYSGVGKESISPETEIVDEIKLACMDVARGLQRFLSGKQRSKAFASKYKLVMRYADQLSSDLSALSGIDKEHIKSKLENIVALKYKQANNGEDEEIESMQDSGQVLQEESGQ